MSSRTRTSYQLSSEIEGAEDIVNGEMILMTLRKPTELKRIMDSIPKPLRALPKVCLPKWYKLGLEYKLPVPKSCDKVVFSRGRIGEDYRRIGLGLDGPTPNFDLTDPNCYDVSYDYEALHDPHLAHYFQQKVARTRMKELGFCTSDNRAVCSLKEFNQYRKYLYNRYKDRIQMEMQKINERAHDDLVLKKVAVDVATRRARFIKEERAREHLEKYRRMYADEIAEKKRFAKEREKQLRARIRCFYEYREKQKHECLLKSLERDNKIQQKVTTGKELELKRKITLIRAWRANEKRRLARVKQIQQAKTRRIAEEAERSWNKRVQAQNRRLQEEALLLKQYSEDQAAQAKRRFKNALVYAHNTDMNLQVLKLENHKLIRGAEKKYVKLVRNMGDRFEKSKRGIKGMSIELAHQMAKEAMTSAVSNKGDPFMTLGQARIKMDQETMLPLPPLKILENIIETVVVEFARHRVNLLLKDVEDAVQNKFMAIVFNRQPAKTHRKSPRKSIQAVSSIAKQYVGPRNTSIAFATGIERIQREIVEDDLDILKSVKTRTPTPVPSLTNLVEVTFIERVEDLPDPAINLGLPERRKLLEMVTTATKILSRTVSRRVEKGLDITLRKVVMPNVRRKLEWGEVVECLADVVVDNRVNSECPDIRRISEYMSYRILSRLREEMRNEKMPKKAVLKNLPTFTEDSQKDFYIPGKSVSSGNGSS